MSAQEGAKNMFYAEFCPYGNVAYSSFCGSAYTFYAFKTKAERDKYVDVNEYDGCNLTASAISAKQMRCLAGRNFRLEKSFIEPGAYTVEFDRHRLNPEYTKCVLRY